MNQQKRKVQSFYTGTERTLGCATVDPTVPPAEAFARSAAQRYARYPYLPKLMEFARHGGERVLEVGVGEGTDHVCWYAGRALAFGVDLTWRHVEMTHQRLCAYSYEPRVVQADAEHLPFADASFEVVYSCGVLFLCPGLEEAVAEIYRVLRPGGRVVALFYARTSLWRWATHAFAGHVMGECRFLEAETFDDWYGGDGYDYPHIEYVDEKDLRSLFTAFRIESTYRTECDNDMLRVRASRWLPEKLLHPYAQWFGYYITIKARKQ